MLCLVPWCSSGGHDVSCWELSHDWYIVPQLVNILPTQCKQKLFMGMDVSYWELSCLVLVMFVLCRMIGISYLYSFIYCPRKPSFPAGNPVSELAVEMKAIAVEEINREEVKWNGGGGVSWSRDAVRSYRTGFRRGQYAPCVNEIGFALNLHCVPCSAPAWCPTALLTARLRRQLAAPRPPAQVHSAQTVGI
jgi:hypothetical protein